MEISISIFEKLSFWNQKMCFHKLKIIFIPITRWKILIKQCNITHTLCCWRALNKLRSYGAIALLTGSDRQWRSEVSVGVLFQSICRGEGMRDEMGYGNDRCVCVWEFPPKRRFLPAKSHARPLKTLTGITEATSFGGTVKLFITTCLTEYYNTFTCCL